jgi:alpha-mannosidase
MGAARALDPPRVPARLERGPLGTSITVERSGFGSRFLQRFRLLHDRPALQVELEIDWRSRGRLLKASFPFAVPNARALYDLGLGRIERGVNTPMLYEVPAQQWAALEAGDGSFGVGVLTDAKSGWDRPRAQELRLSLIHSPRIGHRFRYQRDQDFGFHRTRYAVAAYSGTAASAEIAWLGARFQQPLRAFFVPRRRGGTREISLLGLDDPRIAVRAFKGAEDGNGLVLRLQELGGTGAEARLRLPDRVVGLAVSSGMEDGLGKSAAVSPAGMGVRLPPFGPATYRLAPRPRPETADGAAMALPFDRRATSSQGAWAGRGFDGRGRTFPAELWPVSVESGGIAIALGPRDGPNTLVCAGRSVSLPGGASSRLVLLATSIAGERLVRFAIDDAEHERLVPDWRAPIAVWNRRRRGALIGDVTRVPVAWVATHLHRWRGDQPYRFGYLFRLELPVPAGARVLRLPANTSVRLFAAVLVAAEFAAATPAAPLYD